MLGDPEAENVNIAVKYLIKCILKVTAVHIIYIF